MDTFETLLFVAEGALFNEKLAENNALKQTLKHFGQQDGPSFRIKYSDLQQHFKLLGQKKRTELLLHNFLRAQGQEARRYFDQQLAKQTRLVKGSLDFLQEVHGKLNLLLYGKEKKEQLWPRLQAAKLPAYFKQIYFADDFQQSLPDKAIFMTMINKAKVDPDTTLVIGTNLSDEIQGAENADLKSLWLAPKKEKIPITPHPTLHLAKLSDLLFYLNIE